MSSDEVLPIFLLIGNDEMAICVAILHSLGVKSCHSVTLPWNLAYFSPQEHWANSLFVSLLWLSYCILFFCWNYRKRNGRQCIMTWLPSCYQDAADKSPCDLRTQPFFQY